MASPARPKLEVLVPEEGRRVESPTPAAALLRDIESRQARVAVMGLGYVGLPLALSFAEQGFSVLGLDVDESKAKALERGESYIGHIAGERIEDAVAAGRFEPSHDLSRLGEADAIVICVPTPLGEHREPDLSFVTATAQQIRRYLRLGQLVSVESTSYPGTTRDVVKPILDEAGLECGSEYFLVFSPEREDPGNATFSTHTIPKLVGGLTSTCLELGVALYRPIIAQVVAVSSPEIAEAAKLLENIYRCVNIALVNELKVVLHRMGINIWEVVEAAATKPFGFSPFYPGPGVGGHCIPIDPFYLTWRAQEYGLRTRFVELAGEVNTAMPAYVFSRIVEALNDRGKALRGAQVMVLGVAYKKDVADLRESAALELIERLQAGGAEVSYCDPHVPRLSVTRRRHLCLLSTDLTPDALRRTDCVVIVTDHHCFDYDTIVAHAPLVVDTRNATRHIAHHRERIEAA